MLACNVIYYLKSLTVLLLMFLLSIHKTLLVSQSPIAIGLVSVFSIPPKIVIFAHHCYHVFKRKISTIHLIALAGYFHYRKGT